ncbi:YcxB family protein [Shewanella sp. VB17]|uniref:YcxB family protein n=1 Tax=Shewanella sp. VB17 TaxID=2739432 RepID=UPI0015634039|nr:YcxB family protein [Shewanella sp. VB17]NRD72622.1 YcxB family protein [Shewanella sp. VB17]
MKTSFSYTKSYILNKEYFIECFEESVTVERSIRAYYKALILFLIGACLLFTGINAYASLFIVGLSAVEALSVRFKKAWWLWRQMISQSANNDVEISINDQGITSKSLYINSQICWEDIQSSSITDRGILIKHPAGTSYLSKLILDQSAIDFIRQKLNNNG